MLTLEPTTRFESLAVDTMHHQLFISAQNSFWAPTYILLPRTMVDPPNLNYDLDSWYLKFDLLAMGST